jgi:hypothetical protein
MVNEEIIGGLISALSRGEPLQQAMMTFYNAGYKKEDIEEAAKTVYMQVGAETSKTGYIQNTIKKIASTVGLVKKNPQPQNPPIKSSLFSSNKSAPENATIPEVQKTKEESEIPKAPLENAQQNPFQENKYQNQNQNKNANQNNQNKSSQKNSYYGGNNSNNYQNVDQVASKIERAIKDLKQISIPSKIEIINRTMDSKQPPLVVQRVSNYSGDAAPPKPVSKAVTFILVFLLILLLGVLAAVFFFKADLIKLFNNVGLS